MKRFFAVVSLLLMPLLLAAQTVVSITIDGTINPATADFMHRAIGKATSENARCLLVHLNTPGGLLQSTRTIVGDMLGSEVPVIVYVSPAGSRAGSAGVFITLAAHVAAMAPGTNIGAAHPVLMEGKVDTVMNEKITNDAIAFIRTIAEKRGRNGLWAEDAVRKSVSLTETEALENKVIDLVATNTQDLLQKVDGRQVMLSSGNTILHTSHARIETLEMSTSESLLNFLSNPDIMYVLLILGMLGILFELYNPGAILPGIIGVICLIFSFYAMSALPVNYAGLALIIFGVILFLLEIKITSHGLLAIGGIASLLLGSLMLVHTGPSFDVVKISKSVIFTSVALMSLFFIFIVGMGLKAQRARTVTGIEGLTGETGEALETLAPSGMVRVHGELWQAESVGEKILQGERIRVARVVNLKLYVESIHHTVKKESS